MQSVRREQNAAHAKQQSVPPSAAHRRGNRMLSVSPILPRIQTADAAKHGQQGEKKCADAVELKVNWFAADNEFRAPAPRRTSRQNPDGGGKRRHGSEERACQPTTRQAPSHQRSGQHPNHCHQKKTAGSHGCWFSLRGTARSSAAMSAAKISSSVAPSTKGRCRPPRRSALLNCDSNSRCARGEGATKNNSRVIGTSSGTGSLNSNASRKIKMAKVPASRPSATG